MTTASGSDRLGRLYSISSAFPLFQQLLMVLRTTTGG
jgi:hypothetical protein